MRVIETKVYTFDELSQEAKEKAIERFRYKEYAWAEDSINSLEQFFEEIGCKLINYSIDWLFSKYCHVKYTGEPIDADIKEYFTGYCMDYPLSKNWNESRDIDKCVKAFFNECNEDYEYSNSDEYIIGLIEDNEYEFTEDGELI